MNYKGPRWEEQSLRDWKKAQSPEKHMAIDKVSKDPVMQNLVGHGKDSY